MRRNKTESTTNYIERIRTREVLLHKLFWKDDLDIESYAKLLEDNSIEYVDIEFETKSGGHCKMVIPSCNFRTLTRPQINTLLRGMK